MRKYELLRSRRFETRQHGYRQPRWPINYHYNLTRRYRCNTKINIPPKHWSVRFSFSKTKNKYRHYFHTRLGQNENELLYRRSTTPSAPAYVRFRDGRLGWRSEFYNTNRFSRKRGCRLVAIFRLIGVILWFCLFPGQNKSIRVEYCVI